MPALEKSIRKNWTDAFFLALVHVVQCTSVHQSAHAHGPWTDAMMHADAR
jgi:hypothetical protein